MIGQRVHIYETDYYDRLAFVAVRDADDMRLVTSRQESKVSKLSFATKSAQLLEGL
jgi:hypothetical protein